MNTHTHESSGQLQHSQRRFTRSAGGRVLRQAPKQAHDLAAPLWRHSRHVFKPIGSQGIAERANNDAQGLGRGQQLSNGPALIAMGSGCLMVLLALWGPIVYQAWRTAHLCDPTQADLVANCRVGW